MAWKSYAVIAPDNTASASTISSSSVFGGNSRLPGTSQSLIIIEEGIGMSIKRTTEHIVGIHPGEMLREELMLPLQLSSNALAMSLRVPATRVLEIVHERRGMSADTALRPARYLETSARFWMNMQQNYDLAVAKEVAGFALAQVERRSA